MPRRGPHRQQGSDIRPADQTLSALISTDTIIRSPALNAPSSQQALPRRRESWPSRSRTRSMTSGMRSAAQGLSRSKIRAVVRSRIGGSTVLSAANIQVIARARTLTSSGSSPRMMLCDVGTRLLRSRTGRDRLPHRSESVRTDEAQMGGFPHRRERHEANRVRLTHFFQCPAHARIARQSLAAIGRPFEGGNRDGQREAPAYPNARQPLRPRILERELRLGNDYLRALPQPGQI